MLVEPSEALSEKIAKDKHPNPQIVSSIRG